MIGFQYQLLPPGVRSFKQSYRNPHLGTHWTGQSTQWISLLAERKQNPLFVWIKISISNIFMYVVQTHSFFRVFECMINLQPNLKPIIGLHNHNSGVNTFKDVGSGLGRIFCTKPSSQQFSPPDWLASQILDLLQRENSNKSLP